MKRRTIFSVFLIVAFLLLSCGQGTSVERRIASLDSLADYAADSALSELRGLAPQVSSLPERVLRRWQLACIKAEDKTDVPFVSDSLIKILVSYFDKHGSIAEQMEAHFYEGRTYYELHDSPRAVVGFRKAVELYEKNESLEPRIAANACSQLADLFWRQYDSDNALVYAKKGMNVARENDFCDPIYIMDVATCYMRKKNQDSVLHYCNMALCDILARNAVAEYGECVAEIFAFYSCVGNRSKAEECFDLLSDVEPSRHPRNLDLAKATFFGAFGPSDSALYYNKQQLEKTGNFYGRKDASRALMWIYGDRKDYEQAWRYARIYGEAEDSIRSMLKMEQTRNANNEFEYRRDMEAEAENVRRTARAERWLMLVVGGSVVLLLGGLLLHVNRRRRLTQRLLEQERAMAQQRTELEAARSRLEELGRELKVKDAARETAVKMMLRAEANVGCPDVVRLFQEAAKGRGIVDDADWRRLAGAVEEMHPGFSDSMIARWPDIAPDCQHIAYLLQIGMEVSEIMRVMGMPRSTIYRKAQQVKEQLS